MRNPSESIPIGKQEYFSTERPLSSISYNE